MAWLLVCFFAVSSYTAQSCMRMTPGDLCLWRRGWQDLTDGIITTVWMGYQSHGALFRDRAKPLPSHVVGLYGTVESSVRPLCCVCTYIWN